MRTVVINVYEAKTRLSELLERAEGGEDFVLGRAGKPVARLIPYRPERAPRLPGRLAGRITMAPDFDETPEELLEAFEGRG